MDQARWLVVLSVIIVMLTVLTFLSKQAEYPSTVNQTEIVQSQQKHKKTEQTTRPYTASRRKIRQPSASNIKYSTPPKHVFAIDTDGLKKDNEKIVNQIGK